MDRVVPVLKGTASQIAEKVVVLKGRGFSRAINSIYSLRL
jgi:hypothetical protein